MEKSTVVVTTEKYHSRSEENSTHEYPIDNPFSTPHDQRSIISSAQQYSIFTGMELVPNVSFWPGKSKPPHFPVVFLMLTVFVFFSTIQTTQAA